jgi:hypothetical protein
MRLTTKDLTKEFYDMVKEHYPDIDLQEMRDIVTAPWKYAREQIEKGELPVSVRFKYFGKFYTSKRFVQSGLNSIKKRFDKGYMDHDEYFRMKKKFDLFLEQDENTKEQKFDT